MKRLALAAALCLGVVAPALAAPPVHKDQLTVSGRFDLPRATEAPLKAGLAVADVKLDATAAKALVGKPDAVNSALRQSFEATLRNFGYLGEASAALPVTATVAPFEVVKEEEKTLVISRIDFAAGGESEAARCVPLASEGRFTALKPQSAGNGNRAAGVLALIAFAAVGYNASQLVLGQFETANAEQRALNARRLVAQGEGVSMSSKEADMLQFAAINATQLAMADFIRQLGESPCSPKGPAAGKPTTQAVVAEEPVAPPATAAQQPTAVTDQTTAPST